MLFAPGQESPASFVPPRVRRARDHPVRMLELNIHSADFVGLDNVAGIYARFSIGDKIVYETDHQTIRDGVGPRWCGGTKLVPFAEWASSQFSICQGNKVLGIISGDVRRFIGHYITRPADKVGILKIMLSPAGSEINRYALLRTRTVEAPFSSPNITHKNWKSTRTSEDDHPRLTPRRSSSCPPFSTLYPSNARSSHTPRLPLDASRDHLSRAAKPHTCKVPGPSDKQKEYILRRFYRPHLPYKFIAQGRVDLGDGTLLKHGEKISIAEAARMQHVYQTTSIPVPRVHYAFEHDGYGYIVMDLIPGDTLKTQIPGLTDLGLNAVAAKLVEYIHELRGLQNTDGVPSLQRLMGSWPSGPFKNLFFDPPPFRAFKWVEELNEHLLRTSLRYYAPRLLETGRVTPVVLSHGDLNPHNIMIKDGRISGILDWETLGYYPDWWECMGVGMPAESRWRDALWHAWDMIGKTESIWRDYEAIYNDVWFARNVY